MSLPSRELLAVAAGMLLAAGCERAAPTRPSAEVTIEQVAGSAPQVAVVGAAVPVAPSVRVLDAQNRPLAGARVVFIPQGNRGVVSGAEVDTDANGIATVGAWTMGTVAGTHEVSVICTASTSAAQVLFTANATPGPITGIAVSPATLSVAPGGTRALTASTIDRYGNIIAAGVNALFASTNPAIASVSTTGVVNGATVGVTRIEATFGAFTRTVWTAVGSRPTGASIGTVGVGQGAYGIAVSSNDVLFVGGDSHVARFGLPSESPGTPMNGVNRALGVAFLPDGATAYVASFSGDRLHIVDVGANAILRSIEISNPTRVIASPDGAYVYVATFGGDLIRMNTGNDSLTTLRLGGRLQGLALSGTRPALYVTNAEGTVFDVDLPTFALRLSRNISGTVQGIAVSLDGTRLFVANEGGALQVLDAMTLVQRSSVAAANGAFALGLTRDGSQLYVAQSTQQQVTVIDADTYAVVRTFSVTLPRHVTFNRSGTLGVITNESGGTAYFVR